MKKALGLVLMCALLATPVAAVAGTACPMMTPPAFADASVSAQPGSCCPQGHCDCSVQAPTPYPATTHSSFSQVTDSGTAERASVLTAVVSPAMTVTSARQSESESPPPPEKTYKRISQYRI